MRRVFLLGALLAGCDRSDPIVGSWSGEYEASYEGESITGEVSFTASVDEDDSRTGAFEGEWSVVYEDGEQAVYEMSGEWDRQTPHHEQRYRLYGELSSEGEDAATFMMSCVGEEGEIECNEWTVEDEVYDTFELLMAASAE